MSNKDKANLLAILDSSRKINLFVTDHNSGDSLFQDIESFDAVLLNFVVIGEAVNRLSEGLKKENKHIPWQQIKRFRNIVAHDYFGVDAEEVWEIISQHLPPLEHQIKEILEK